MTTEVRGPGGFVTIIELTKEIKKDPDNPLLHAERSECFRGFQYYYHALQDAEKVISLRPKWHKGYYLKGLALHGAEDYKSALETFEDGLDYSNDEHMIKAMQKANRAMFRRRFNDKLRTVAGFFLGCLVGVLALGVNDLVLPKPVISNAFLKIGVIGLWCFCGQELGSKFNKMLKDECKKRLQAPEELFPYGKESTDKKKESSSGRSQSRNVNVGTSTEGIPDSKNNSRTKQRLKQGKS